MMVVVVIVVLAFRVLRIVIGVGAHARALFSVFWRRSSGSRANS
jgi:hypothetical protein